MIGSRGYVRLDASAIQKQTGRNPPTAAITLATRSGRLCGSHSIPQAAIPRPFGSFSSGRSSSLNPQTIRGGRPVATLLVLPKDAEACLETAVTQEGNSDPISATPYEFSAQRPALFGHDKIEVAREDGCLA